MSLIGLQAVTRTVELPDADPLTILNGIDLELSVGDRVSIVGRSGSGKSTLLNVLGLLDTPTSGAMTFDDRPVESFSAGQRNRIRGRDIGFIFQQFNLLPGRTALENVVTPLLYATGRQFWQRTKIGLAMLECVGLADRAGSMPQQLSGGEQQRVAIARALVRGPRLILADEPTGALDIETGEQVMAILDEAAMASGAALVTITHDPAIAGLADTHYHLVAGHLTGTDATVMR